MIGNFDNEEIVEERVDEKQSRIRHRKEYSLHYPTGDIRLSFIDDNAFVFHDVSGAFIGKITINDLIQYVTLYGYAIKSKSFGYDKDTSDAVAKKNHIEPNTAKLIEMTVCTIRDTKDKSNNIFLNQKSPFLNDIEILVVLNRWFRRVDGSIKDMPENEQHIIRKFICQILEHSLKVIAVISRSLHQSESSNELKKKLMRYSSEILFRLTTIVNTETNICLDKYNKLRDTSDMLQSIEQKINEKLHFFDTNQDSKKTMTGGSCIRGSLSCVPYQ